MSNEMPLALKDLSPKEYAEQMKGYLSQPEIQKRMQESAVHRVNTGYIDTCEGMDEVAVKTISGIRDFIDDIFSATSPEKKGSNE